MFIQTESTPNPNALKFLPGIEVSPEQPVYMTSSEGCNSLLARKLFAIKNVEGVFFGSDFITITSCAESNWDVMKPEIIMTIMDHFVAGMPVFDDIALNKTQISQSDLTEIEKQIIEIIETRVRPSVAMDGGDIVYQGFENGIVLLELRGACSGCPSSSVTLKDGIESMLKHYVPEVIGVEAV
jgi:Fe-S cluster biogenesis protein NfuA